MIASRSCPPRLVITSARAASSWRRRIASASPFIASSSPSCRRPPSPPSTLVPPPAMLGPVVPVCGQARWGVALVDQGIAHKRDQAPHWPRLAPTLGVDLVLHQAGKARSRPAQSDRAGRKIDVILVLGARGI